MAGKKQSTKAPKSTKAAKSSKAAKPAKSPKAGSGSKAAKPGEKELRAAVARLQVRLERAEAKVEQWKAKAKEQGERAKALEKRVPGSAAPATRRAVERVEDAAAEVVAVTATTIDPSDSTRPDESWTVTRLRAEARVRGVSNYSRKNKAQLVAELR